MNNSPVYEIKASAITEKVRELFLHASTELPEGMKKLIKDAEAREQIPFAKQIFKEIIKNYELASERKLPICQDCGLAVVFIDIGQDVHIVEGSLEDAINEGARRAYVDGYLRKSVDSDPVINRVNSGDNTPAIIHVRIVPGNSIKIVCSPKGNGSENMSKIFMLKPAQGRKGVIDAVIETVRAAGPNPCPPIVLGIGIGGNFETVALASKRALLEKEGIRNSIPEYAEMEEEIIKKTNELGIGPCGYGGLTTVLDAHIIALPTHIAGLPVAINICCHALRHAEGILEGVVCND